jgi:hypothetical protein
MPDSPRPEWGLPQELPVSDHLSDIVRIDHIVFTRAQCDLAWKVFADCRHWPRFSELYGSSMRWQGVPWTAGSRLYFDILEPERTRVECVITLCTPPQCAAWINHVSGHTMQQCVLFEPYVGGGTKVTTWIELTHPGLRSSITKIRSVLKSLLQTWFDNFISECDHQARAAGSRSVAEPGLHSD